MDLGFIESEELRGQVETLLKSEVETAVEGLKKDIKGSTNEEVTKLLTKNEELIGEKRKIQEMLKTFEGIDPEKAKSALSFLDENEDASLLKEGKVQELVDKKTSGLKSDYDTKIEELMGKMVDAEDRATTSETKYSHKVVQDALRDEAIAAGVRPEALPDLLSRSSSVFSMSKDSSVEARDTKGKLVKTSDDLILTPALWIEGLKKVAPHYWPPSTGAGATGISTSSMTDLEAALSDAAGRGDMKAFRSIREKMEKV